MEKSKQVLNELFVELFNDISAIEENTLKNGVLSDLSLTELHTIDAIGMYGEKTMGSIAENLDITQGTLTIAINKLIKKGYVARRKLEKDTRVVVVWATKKGKIAYRLHRKFHSDMISMILEEINEKEEAVLINALDKLNMFFKEKYLQNNKRDV